MSSKDPHAHITREAHALAKRAARKQRIPLCDYVSNVIERSAKAALAKREKGNGD